jgi:4-coumarate--CoA ligase
VYVLHVEMFLGNTLIIISAFDFNAVLSYIQKYKMTKLYLVPPIVVRLVKDPATEKYDLSSMEQITCGAAPLGSDTMAMLRSKFKGIAFKQGTPISLCI